MRQTNSSTCAALPSSPSASHRRPFSSHVEPTRFSADGDARLTALAAAALGGQPALCIDFIVAPRNPEGSAAACETAARQALAIVSNLVEVHGFAPETVRATAVQGNTMTIALVPTEAGGYAYVEVVRRSGDRVGELVQALTDAK